MRQADQPPITSRRAALSLSVAAVLTAGRAVSDGELIAVSAQFRQAIAEVNALPDDADYDQASDAIAERLEALLEPLTSLRATTTEGHRARAAAVWAYLDPDQRDAAAGCFDRRLCAAVLRDILEG